MNHQESLTAYIAAFVSELVLTGITDVVVSPGSRSTPMAMVMAEHPDLKVHIHVDERSAAFFGLGMAKAKNMPVAILCTSGTAAANYFPAIVEAKYSRVPLLVLTADRPHELREVGAPQAIDQLHLYGQHVKWFADMALPENSNEMLRYARTICARAAAIATQAPAGPVHLNFPFREPLIPKIDESLFALSERPKGYVKVHNGDITISDEEVKDIAKDLTGKEKGMIVCGNITDEKFAKAVTDLGAKLNFPILADPLSQLRSGRHKLENIIDAYDTFLRNEDAKSLLKPDVVLRFGAMPVSKALTIFLKEQGADHFVIDGGGGWRDPSTLSSSMIFCNETMFCEKLVTYLDANSSSSFLDDWKKVNQLTKEHMAVIRDVRELSEGKLFYQLVDQLPEEATLFVGNSMPIRDLDSFFLCNHKSIKVMANRGANGIDGTVSTAIGAAVYTKSLYLVLGDLTFFHDLNGLIAAKLYDIDIHIILINNNGGGIFSFLPQSEHPQHFELLFGTPLNINFEHAVKMFNGNYNKIATWDQLGTLLKQSHHQKGIHVYEIETNRNRNRDEHRELWRSVSQEISNLVDGAQE
ncbi:2-succinyl-5-enolpyruvyl-6-hydroxy-3-cyclohexene-1-carboxylic-acid synthase [Bacillus sp. AFS076308]|uniref:2-succinyl-5-enolpyruvyl-6-hydroxy-3- cyclohexene-1-carboxylic-acid synthase n=1 Tax=unclassified Bacillus (in: firmicutes) TaxID=185979 RepID=UPI000BF96D19|nr:MULTISPECIES: 2-succinyl-5-enolpyruvyl-6-hydroxy-3-cyclohexene-1-carboxylic-acid synthase [unclassified Bacillus (in: firmicutes)]PFN95787.1 2-succinyl-5-enolpyruvyl-6-hydroxy-3-cyclohexene-1-carboxylic-acid synthase [Bacillus sp. AFS076308]PGV48457.1 2-succinyl-5-enolpyruvyl-6-hydroxy-3-cyclohexene-1-carboxylic-acid synthase [Bacillus sp. AFS037270]